MNLTNIYRLLIPSNYYSKGTWELPHQQLAAKHFLLTWVIFPIEEDYSNPITAEINKLSKK